MNPDKLLKMANYFEKLSQSAEQVALRDKFFNQPLLPNYQWPFNQVAFALFGALEKKQAGLQDAGQAQGPVYRLMNMMGAQSVPDAQSFLNLTKEVASLAKEISPAPSQEANLADHLVRYAQLLINEYLVSKPAKPSNQGDQPQDEGQKTPSAPAPAATENRLQIISRLYRQVASGKSVSDEDQQKWASIRSSIIMRMNGLKGSANRTPQQEQELKVLQTLVEKLG